MAAGRAEEAGALYRRAAELAPDSDELLFWAGPRAGPRRRPRRRRRRGAARGRGQARTGSCCSTGSRRTSPRPARRCAPRSAGTDRSAQQITWRWNEPRSPRSVAVVSVVGLRRRAPASALADGWTPKPPALDAPTAFAVNEHLRDVLVERHGVGVLRRPVAWPRRLAPRPRHERAVGLRPDAKREVAGARRTPSSPCRRPCRRRGWRPCRWRWSRTAARWCRRPGSGPASLPAVTNSNARPPLRLLARTHGSLPGLERQP